jgi:nucleotide-binding universal stress UspA family protein
VVILLCYDGSETSKRAITVGHDLLGDVELVVVHVWESPVGLFVPDPFSGIEGWSQAQVGEVEVVIRERAGRLLAEGVSEAGAAGFKATARLEESTGSPWRTIIDVADELDAGLIILGTHGVSGMRAVLGSVSTAVTHHAKRPLLIVPAVDAK